VTLVSPIAPEGEVVEDVRELFLANVRNPAERRADLRAQIAANERGAERVGDLLADHGDRLLAAFDAVIDFAQIMQQPGEPTTLNGRYDADRHPVVAVVVRVEPVGVPLDANKATLDAYHRRLEAGQVEQSRISVLVVCNDEQMREEGDVADLYGLRDMVQFDIEVRHDLTREEMRETLESDVDFLHYIGHVDDRGMQCAESYLDLTDEELDIGVSAFLLNACQSYQQGEALVHRGSRGGIVTLSDVANSPATQLGRIIARLMNSGFNLRTALHVAKRELITGHQYIVVGDGGTTICRTRGGIAAVMDISNQNECWNVNLRTYPIGPYGVGTLYSPAIQGISMNYVVPSQAKLSNISTEQLQNVLQLDIIPVFHDDELMWSDESLPI
jgi:hypothetical protein